MLESAFHTEPILGGIKLSWTRLNLVQCKWCRKFGHSTLECDVEITSTSKSPKSFKRVVSDENCLQLAQLYAKKGVIGSSPHMVPASTSLKARLASLEHSVKLLVDKVSSIMSKLDNLVLVPSTLTSFSQNLVVLVVANVEFDSNIALNDPKPVLLPSPLVSSSTSDLGLSSSRILTSKVGCLESKLMALEASVCSVLEKLDQMCTGLSSAVSSVSQ
ncbi:hypothetical protein G9A89_015673 [Geosiphon pyriformis]|nr:hypothetical protein G9A89_015673 [Geosiphon pyriformis]